MVINQCLLVNIIILLMSFQLNLIIINSKLNFNLLKIKSIAISSVIIVRGLFDYLYVRNIHDIAIFS